MQKSLHKDYFTLQQIMVIKISPYCKVVETCTEKKTVPQ